MRQPLKQIYVTQRFGENPSIYKEFGLKGHSGIDFRAPMGTEVYAAIEGEVKIITSRTGYGLHIKQRNNKYEICYAHLMSFAVKKNQTVKAGQLIGFTGNTGFTTGPHLHFGIRELGFWGQIKNKDNGYLGWINPVLCYDATQKKEALIDKIMRLFTEKQVQGGSAVVIVPDDHGKVYLIRNGKKREAIGKSKILEALLATHTVGVLKNKLNEIPTGDPL